MTDHICTPRLLAVLVLLCVSAGLHAANWQPLFNGKDLTGWTQRGGKAPYEVKDGVIIGTTVPNTPNSFLCTEKTYGDFILEVEFQVDPRINSGIQFRSLSSPDYQSGRVHGYQCEIDPSPRAYTAGIYDEARRGWLYPLARNEAGQKAFCQGTWNELRIEAIGSDIRTWLNGVQCTNLIDDLTAEGFIALQVHSISANNPEEEGASIMWRKVRILTEDLESERYRPSMRVPQVNLLPNTLSEQELRQGWRLLWDGKTSAGWRSSRSETFPQAGWTMDDGVLSIQASGGQESVKYGDIITKDKFSNFELCLEFKLTEGANSGVKYFVNPDLNQGEGSEIGLEFQILDDERHPDAKKGVAGNRTIGSLYDLIAASNLSVPSRSKVFRGIGVWNQARIVVHGNQVEHWLNGFKVVEYERRTQMYRALVAYSKYRVWPAFGEADAGHLLLQDHGDNVDFRSIKIREF
jgi:hypothetical protein